MLLRNWKKIYWQLMKIEEEELTKRVHSLMEIKKEKDQNYDG